MFMLTRITRPMWILFFVFVYATTGWSLYYCLTTSVTFLGALIKARNGIHLAIWTTYILVHYFLSMWLVVWLLFGQLTILEYEHIFERFDVIVSNVAGLIFRSRIRYPFSEALLFATALHLLSQILHLVLRDRMESIFQSLGTNATWKDLFIAKPLCAFSVLFFTDLKMVQYFWRGYKANRGTGYLLITLDFSILFLDLTYILLQTCLKGVELWKVGRRRDPVVAEGQEEEADADESDVEDMSILEGKFIYQWMIGIFVNILKLLLYSGVWITLDNVGMFSGLIVYNLIVTGMETFQHLRLVINYWKNSKKLYERLTDVTEEQLAAGDSMCIICMDDMLPATNINGNNNNRTAKRLPCGHTLHFGCLKNWMERSQTCPICRLSVLAPNNENTNRNTNIEQERNNDAPHQPAERASFNNFEREQEIPSDTTAYRSHDARNFTASYNQHEQNLISISSSMELGWVSFPIQYKVDHNLYLQLRDEQGNKEWEAIFSTRPGLTYREDVSSTTHPAPSLTEGSSSEPAASDLSASRTASRSCGIITSSYLEQTDEVESLKKKIAALERKINELSKIKAE